MKTFDLGAMYGGYAALLSSGISPSNPSVWDTIVSGSTNFLKGLDSITQATAQAAKAAQAAKGVTRAPVYTPPTVQPGIMDSLGFSSINLDQVYYGLPLKQWLLIGGGLLVVTMVMGKKRRR